MTSFDGECSYKEIPFKYLAFFIVEAVNNGYGLTPNDTEDL